MRTNQIFRRDSDGRGSICSRTPKLPPSGSWLGYVNMDNVNVRRVILALLCVVTVLGDNSARAREDKMAQGIPVTITVGNQVLQATFLDNATSRALVARFPLTVSMMDLYGREMCYRFPDALPADETRRSGYDVGDIAYWTPRHSFVIFYEQNGEIIGNLQKIGRIHSGVELFARTGDTDVTFELLNE